MREAVTISLSKELKNRLDKLANSEKTNRSDIVKEALKRYLAVTEFQKIRKQMIPRAESQGIFVEEDVYKIVS
jgi:predicted transcriptional regulator